MTMILIANASLAAVVLAAVLGLVAWAIRRSRHEGMPVAVASQRRWMRPTHSVAHARAARPEHVRKLAASLHA